MKKIDFDEISYREIEQRYIKYNIPGRYQFENAEQIKKVYGWDFRTIRGFKLLTDEEKKLAENLICRYINMWGLEGRHRQRPRSIKKFNTYFKVNFTNKTYSYLGFEGRIW